MKLALIGLSPAVLPLVRAAQAAGHTIQCVMDVPPEMAGAAPGAKLEPDWEVLLDVDFVDAVIMARGGPKRRAEQLRKLVQAGLPLLVEHPIHTSMLVCYELEMIRQDALGPLIPYLPTRWHPALGRMKQLINREELGAIEQVVMERMPAARDNASVLTQFALDVDVPRQLIGQLNKLGAMAAGGEGESAYGNLGVQLSGSSPAVVRWSVLPADELPAARLILLGSEGRLTLDMPEGDQPWQLTGRTKSGQVQESFTHEAAPRGALHALEQTIAGEPVEPTWNDAARCIELAETIDRSLTKGRVVEIHFDDYSEQATFKGTMTSLGCGLLLVALVLICVAAGLLRAGVEAARFLPHLLLGSLLLFLLLQLLRLVFRRDSDA